ncbi:MAG TPA: hypothetical protein VFJ74_16890 [Gemmatimonadaceae bacterium]|nr:hypothetical protein [Gemmatimonadaceae bacterium]
MATPSIFFRRFATGATGAAVVATLVATLVACSKGDAGARAAADSSATTSAAATGTPSSAAAATGERDLQRLEDYKLSMPKMDQWYGAMRNVAGVVKAHPELKDSFATDGTNSIDEETARIEAMPEFKKAINDAGMSVREFELVMWTSMQAGMAQGAIDAGANRDSIIKNVKVNPDNLAFMKAHAAELKARQQKMEAELGDKP